MASPAPLATVQLYVPASSSWAFRICSPRPPEQRGSPERVSTHSLSCLSPSSTGGILRDLLTTHKPDPRGSDALQEPRFQVYGNQCFPLMLLRRL